MTRFFFTFITPFFLSIFTVSYSQPEIGFETIKKTDINGYEYEIVTNDPTGTRLYTLKNGLKVFLSQNYDEPRVFSLIAVKAGSAFETSDNTGLAHYLEHIMFNGNSKIGAFDWKKENQILKQIEELFELKKETINPVKRKDIHRRIDSLSFEGSKISSFHEYKNLLKRIGVVIPNGITNVDHTIFTSLVPSTSLNKFLNLEAERFSHMEPRSFNSELQIVYEEFNKEMDDIWEKKYYAITEEIFREHPYGQQKVIGISKHLKNPSIKSIREYFNKYYIPNNMSITLVGDLDFENTILMVDKTMGKLKSKELVRPILPEEEEIKKIRRLELTDANEESVYIGFRYKHANSIDEKYVTIIDLMLANGTAGFFDSELKSKQMVKDAKSYIIKNRDYGIHLLDGYPKQNQTLEEVESLLIAQLKKIKTGQFEDWLLGAIVNQIKIEENKNFSKSRSLANIIYTDYINERTWRDRVSYTKEIEEITKQDVIDFANKFYNNYVVLYKRKGESTSPIKVEKQKITSLIDNSGKKSDFAKKIELIPADDIKLEFPNFQKDIKIKPLTKVVDLSYVQNKSNSNFELHFIYNAGSNQLKKLPLAIEYIKNLGTTGFTKPNLDKEFFKYGLKINFSVNTDRTFVSIAGIQKNIEKALELFSHLLMNIEADNNLFEKFIQNNEKKRFDDKNDVRFIRYNLIQYTLYGENHRQQKILKNHQISDLNENELIDIFKNLTNYKLDVFYYGNNLEESQSILKKYIERFSSKITTKTKEYKLEKIASKNLIYFINREDLKQADISIISRTEKFNPKNLPYNNLLNFYLSNTFGKEIREKRALFYSGYASINEATSKTDYDYLNVNVGTQVDKLQTTLRAILKYLNHLPFNDTDFDITKTDLLKRYEASRINGTGIYWNYASLMKKGITEDITEYKYKKIKSIALDDLKKYYESKIKNHSRSILIIANKKQVDMKELSKFGKIVEVSTNRVFGY